MRPVHTLLASLAFALAFLAGGAVADAAPLEEEPGCIPGASGYRIQLCLTTPPPLAPVRAEAVADAATPFVETVRTPFAELRIDSDLGMADRAAVFLAIGRDVPAVEDQFGRRFAPRPVIWIFATVGTFEYAVQTLYGQSPHSARALGLTGGVMDRRGGSIAINWQRVAAQRPIEIIRHELAHVLARQILGSDAEVPAWFEEGLAALAQRSASPSRGLDDDRVAGALLDSRTLTLAQLVTAQSWLRAATTGPDPYVVAGAAAETLRSELGAQGLVRILELTGGGQSFEDSFADVTRRSVQEFSGSVGATIAARAPAAITVAPGSDRAGNVTFRIAGFPPGAQAEVTIEGTATDRRAYRIVYEVLLDRVGSAGGQFGSTAPPGTYAIRVRSGAISAAAVLRTYGAS